MHTYPIIHSYKDLLVWQRSMSLASEIFSITRTFPSEEQFGMTSQMRRAAVSIPSNIAEGRQRGSKKEFKRFLHIAYGSGAELETQIMLAKTFSHLGKHDFQKADALLLETMKMLNSIINKLSTKKLKASS